jgi:hypothetical protein
MKFDRNKAFPYPVLRPYCDDYVDVEFQSTVEFEISKVSVVIKVTYAISSEELVSEIEKGNAVYVSIVSCRDTYFRSVLTSKEPKFEQSFDVGSLKGEVCVDPYIVAIKNIPNFKSSDINKEFNCDSFSFSPGDVLAQDETQVFYIDRDLFKPVSSVVDLVKSDLLSNGEWRVGLEENHIQIQVGQQMKESIDNARNDKSKQVVLLNSLYFPAVVHALQTLKECQDAYENQRWAQVILMKLHNFGWDLKEHEAYILAQRLMKHPLALLDTYVLKGKD